MLGDPVNRLAPCLPGIITTLDLSRTNFAGTRHYYNHQEITPARILLKPSAGQLEFQKLVFALHFGLFMRLNKVVGTTSLTLHPNHI